jgi:hypothetical protein
MPAKKSRKQTKNLNIETEVKDNDIVERVVKNKKKTSHGLDMFGGDLKIITTQENKQEELQNKRLANKIKKSYRQPYYQVQCENVNCRNGPNNKPYIGSESVFNMYRGMKVCPECINHLFGS